MTLKELESDCSLWRRRNKMPFIIVDNQRLNKQANIISRHHTHWNACVKRKPGQRVWYYVAFQAQYVPLSALGHLLHS